MKYSFGISDFLEEIPSLSHSVVFLSFFALITEEGFLISPCSSLELRIQMGISLLFTFLLFTAICKASSESCFAFLHFFSMGMVLIPAFCTMSWTSIYSSSSTLQYCSLQHRTLLLSSVTSTTGYYFCFGSIPSFFLELFLHLSPVAYWAPTDLGSSFFSILSFCLFILFMGFSRQEYWGGFPFPSPVDHILSDLSTMTLLSWVAPQGMS